MPSNVEPFIYNGTTYLPVRAVAEALGEKVEYDKNSSTVYIGEKIQIPKTNGISLLEYTKKKPFYGAGAHAEVLTSIDGKNHITAAQDNHKFTTVIPGSSSGNLRLNSNFKSLKGRFVIRDTDTALGYTSGYGDIIVSSLKKDGCINQELYTTTIYQPTYGQNLSTGWTYGGFAPIDFEIDLVGVDAISIYVAGDAFMLDPTLVPLK